MNKLLLLVIIIMLFSCNWKNQQNTKLSNEEQEVYGFLYLPNELLNIKTICDCSDFALIKFEKVYDLWKQSNRKRNWLNSLNTEESKQVDLLWNETFKIDNYCWILFSQHFEDIQFCEGWDKILYIQEKIGLDSFLGLNTAEFGNTDWASDLIEFDMEEIEMLEEIKQVTPPPPPPPEIEVVDDEIEIEEEIEWDDVELEEDEEIEIEEEEEEEVDIVDMAIVESIPIFPGCKKSSASDYNTRRQEDLQCFNSGIMNHIKDEFKYPEIAKEMGISEKIYVQFVIDKKGIIKDAKVVRGENKYLKEEALRLVNGLPKMTPASQRNKPVGVPYTIPIHFKLQ